MELEENKMELDKIKELKTDKQKQEAMKKAEILQGEHTHLVNL